MKVLSRSLIFSPRATAIRFDSVFIFLLRRQNFVLLVTKLSFTSSPHIARQQRRNPLGALFIKTGCHQPRTRRRNAFGEKNKTHKFTSEVLFFRPQPEKQRFFVVTVHRKLTFPETASGTLKKIPTGLSPHLLPTLG